MDPLDYLNGPLEVQVPPVKNLWISGDPGISSRYPGHLFIWR